MTNCRAALLVVASGLALTAPSVPAQMRPPLADYFTAIPPTVLDPGYRPLNVSFAVTQDLNGDGHGDLIVLGANYPSTGAFNVPQPGRVFLGDGEGHFAIAPADLFPVDTLMTVHPRKVLFADFNADGRPDMFISSHGWDAAPWPGEQNALYLSRPEGGWRDATANLPQLSDFSHSSAVGDLSGRGLIDIFVGNASLTDQRGLPYTLLNTGSGQFTQTTSNIPVGRGQLLDQRSGHSFVGATLTDLNADGLPELIIGTDIRSGRALLRSTIFWNRNGVFVDTDTTELPSPSVFEYHLDYDIQRIDVNRDGLPDLVLVGTQTIPLRGWFVQVFVNQGNRQFVDETAARVPEGAWGGIAGVQTTAAWPVWVRVLDFNEDGAPDFSVEWAPNSTGRLPQDQPLVWLNDGTGRFSTLEVGDFEAPPAPGNVQLVGTGHLVATRNGYSFIRTHFFNGVLRVTGLLASRPYRITPPSAAPQD